MKRHKQLIATLLTGIMATSLLTGCSNANVTTENEPAKFEVLNTDMKVGMVTDAGTIDDRSFNQGTWEGISGAISAAKYLQPNGTTTSDFLQEISNLYDAGYKFIVTPGYVFESAVFKAQSKYPDAKFLLLDGVPHNGDYNASIGENTVCVSFSEHEAGFLAGVATAVELQDAEAAFLGGVEVPAVQKYNWGFQQGLAYANDYFDTNVTIEENRVLYQGSFDDKAAGQQIASQWLDAGVDVIFGAAGGTSVGAMTEVKSRASKGDAVWMIGVDIDQYAEGIYDTAANKSVMLTSAMKYLDQATYDIIKSEVEGNYPGGEALVFTVANDGVGIPANNPNLSDSTMEKVSEVIELIKDGTIVVADNNNEGLLIK